MTKHNITLLNTVSLTVEGRGQYGAHICAFLANYGAHCSDEYRFCFLLILYSSLSINYVLFHCILWQRRPHTLYESTWGSGEIAPFIPNLSTGGKRAVSSTPHLLYLQVKCLQSPTNRGWVGGLLPSENTKGFFPYQEMIHVSSNVQHAALSLHQQNYVLSGARVYEMYLT